MHFEIKNRFTGSAVFAAELDARHESEPYSIQLGAAVKLAVKAGADLARANLAGAYLPGADLAGANLARANLARADLTGGVTIRDGITVTQAPICISGLAWLVTIWDRHMQIGCEFHSHDEWRHFATDDWLRMGGKTAVKLRDQHLGVLMALCDAHAANERSAAAA